MKTLMVTVCMLGILFFMAPSTKGGEMLKYADNWTMLSHNEKFCYMMGFQDGAGNTYITAATAWLPSGKLFEKPEPENVAKVRKKTHLMVDTDAIIKVMDNLYKDPSNAFIRWSDMVLIARDKLLGEDVEAALANARKSAVETNNINNIIDKK